MSDELIESNLPEMTESQYITETLRWLELLHKFTFHGFGKNSNNNVKTYKIPQRQTIIVAEAKNAKDLEEQAFFEALKYPKPGADRTDSITSIQFFYGFYSSRLSRVNSSRKDEIKWWLIDFNSPSLDNTVLEIPKWHGFKAEVIDLKAIEDSIQNALKVSHNKKQNKKDLNELKLLKSELEGKITYNNSNCYQIDENIKFRCKMTNKIVALFYAVLAYYRVLIVLRNPYTYRKGEVIEVGAVNGECAKYLKEIFEECAHENYEVDFEWADRVYVVHAQDMLRKHVCDKNLQNKITLKEYLEGAELQPMKKEEDERGVKSNGSEAVVSDSATSARISSGLQPTWEDDDPVDSSTATSTFTQDKPSKKYYNSVRNAVAYTSLSA